MQINAGGAISAGRMSDETKISLKLHFKDTTQSRGPSSENPTLLIEQTRFGKGIGNRGIMNLCTRH